MTRVFTCENVTELHFVLGLLRNQGIDAVTQNESSSWNWFELPVGERPGIVVRDDERVQLARSIVEEYMHHRVDDGSPHGAE